MNLLVNRLKSLSSVKSYELAGAIEKFCELFKGLPFSTKDHIPMPEEKFQVRKNFNECLKFHKHEPLLFYHYAKGKDNHLIRNKIGMNNILRDMTFQDDLKMFQESLFVVPAENYFEYMKSNLENYFNKKNKVLQCQMNTIIGIKTINMICYNFSVDEGKVIVVTFPKQLQSLELQQLYEKTLFQIKKKEYEKKLIENKKLIRNNYVSKNLENWEQLIKYYYEPYTFYETSEEFKEYGKIKYEEEFSFGSTYGYESNDFSNKSLDSDSSKIEMS